MSTCPLVALRLTLQRALARGRREATAAEFLYPSSPLRRANGAAGRCFVVTRSGRQPAIAACRVITRRSPRCPFAALRGWRMTALSGLRPGLQPYTRMRRGVVLLGVTAADSSGVPTLARKALDNVRTIAPWRFVVPRSSCSLRSCWRQESCFEVLCECQTRCCRTSAVRLTDARTLSSISGMRDTSTP